MADYASATYPAEDQTERRFERIIGHSPALESVLELGCHHLWISIQSKSKSGVANNGCAAQFLGAFDRSSLARTMVACAIAATSPSFPWQR